MLKIAITGNIASGKSTVENILKKKGFAVFDTDKIAHSILESSEEVRAAFKEYDILTDGNIDRQKLAKVVFSNKELLKTLEAIVHLLVKKEILKIFEGNYEAVFISVPQLFEANFENLFDKIIYVTAPKDVRLNRLMKRNGYTKEEALQRISAQADDAQKIGKSDIVIENNGDINNLKNSIDSILKI